MSEANPGPVPLRFPGCAALHPGYDSTFSKKPRRSPGLFRILATAMLAPRFDMGAERMKLEIWKLPQLPGQQGFFVDLITQRAGRIEIHICQAANPKLKAEFIFSDHCGVLISSEFGMYSYLEKDSRSGSNFMIARHSEFLEFCEKGDTVPQDWSTVQDYVITDADHWIEILALEPPGIKITIE
jgi:hypothetical protein